MDRRRFVPASEDLEGRKLLSSIFGYNGTNIFYAPQPALNSAVQQARRINHLPNFLAQIEQGRYLSPELTKQVQTDLRAIQDKLPRPANSQILNNFNHQLRYAMPRQNLTVGSARGLSYTFGQALLSTGATPQATARLQNDLNQMVKIDQQSPNPVTLATNDYGTILQTALAVGRFIQRPKAPILSVHSALDHKSSSNVSVSPQPYFVGNYHTGASIQIVNSQGTVLGIAVVQKSGRYKVQIATPLANGLYKFYAQAKDVYGDLSHFSPPLKVRVLVPHPGAHPLG